MTFQAKKPTWNIPAGTQLPVVVQIGLDTPWNLQGAGNGQVVEWSLDRERDPDLRCPVPPRRVDDDDLSSGNEPPWTVALNGSTAISNAFGRCVTDMTTRARRSRSPQPAPVPSGPTQPFSEAPTQPVTQEPTQPSPPR